MYWFIDSLIRWSVLFIDLLIHWFIVSLIHWVLLFREWGQHYFEGNHPKSWWTYTLVYVCPPKCPTNKKTRLARMKNMGLPSTWTHMSREENPDTMNRLSFLFTVILAHLVPLLCVVFSASSVLSWPIGECSGSCFGLDIRKSYHPPSCFSHKHQRTL